MKRVVAIAMLAFCLAAIPGCRTAGRSGPASMQVSVRADGKVSVQGRVVPMQDVGKLARSAGATAQTTIEMAVQGPLPQAEMMRITRILRDAGFVRVVFTRPRRAEAIP